MIALAAWKALVGVVPGRAWLTILGWFLATAAAAEARQATVARALSGTRPRCHVLPPLRLVVVSADCRLLGLLASLIPPGPPVSTPSGNSPTIRPHDPGTKPRLGVRTPRAFLLSSVLDNRKDGR